MPPRGAGGSYITETKNIPGGGKTFYGRMLFWFEQLPLQKPGSLYHWVMVAPQGGGMNLRIGGHVERDGSNWIRFNPGGPGGETGLSDLTAVMEAKRWYCLEWYFDTPNNEARFWFDGQERPVLHWKDSVAGWHFPPGGITSIGFGFEEYQGAPSPFELFIDEIALGTQRIGCGGAPVLADPSDTSTLTTAGGARKRRRLRRRRRLCRRTEVLHGSDPRLVQSPLRRRRRHLPGGVGADRLRRPRGLRRPDVLPGERQPDLGLPGRVRQGHVRSPLPHSRRLRRRSILLPEQFHAERGHPLQPVQGRRVLTSGQGRP